MGAVFGGIGGGMGGGGVWPVIGIAIGLFHLPAGAIGAVIPLWLGTTYMTARTAYHASTKRRGRGAEQPAGPPGGPGPGGGAPRAGRRGAPPPGGGPPPCLWKERGRFCAG